MLELRHAPLYMSPIILKPPRSTSSAPSMPCTSHTGAYSKHRCCAHAREVCLLSGRSTRQGRGTPIVVAFICRRHREVEIARAFCQCYMKLCSPSPHLGPKSQRAQRFLHLGVRADVDEKQRLGCYGKQMTSVHKTLLDADYVSEHRTRYIPSALRHG